jgi:cytochrome P450
VVDRTIEARPIPGPKGQFILGSARAFQEDKLGFLRRCAEEFGDVFRFSVGPVSAVVVNDLDVVHEILVEKASHYVKGAVTRDIFGRVMGSGLMVSEGDVHKQRRKLVQRGFDGERLKAYFKIAERHASAAVSRWRDGDELDVEAEMARITIGVTADVLFGADLTPEIERLTAALVSLQTSAAKLFNSSFVPPRWLPTPMNRELVRATSVVDEVLTQVVLSRRGAHAGREDLLSALLSPESNAAGELSAEGLRDELRTLFLAGVETTANALTWTFYHLARSPEVRQKLEEAVSSGFPEFGAAHYATTVVKESLRCSNPVWAFNRSPLAPEVVKGYRLRPKDLVLISPYLLHRDRRYFANPERFDPERFSEEREQEIPRLAFLPFGAGPRHCIGSRLALQELVVVVSAVTRHFRLELPDERVVEPEAFVTIRPRGGLKMRARARN